MRRLKLIWVVLCLVLLSGRGMGQPRILYMEERVPVAHGDTARGFLFMPMGVRPANGYPGILLLHDHGAYFELGAKKFWTRRGSIGSTTIKTYPTCLPLKGMWY